MEARTTRPDAPSDTGQRILDEAERLVQTRGFNGFSYADIAAVLGVTKASLHYHFASKAELGRRLIERYVEDAADALRRIDAEGGDACVRLERYVAIYEGVLSRGRMCLCGMLAAEFATLPEPMREALAGYFDMNEAWLSSVLETGRAAGDLVFDGDAREAAGVFIGGLEGLMLLARTGGGPARFATGARLLLENFCHTRRRNKKSRRA